MVTSRERIQDQITMPGVGRRTLSADPTREYVAGGAIPYAHGYLQSLPFGIDDISRDFGDDIYDRMMKDPAVASSVNVLKLAVLYAGIDLTPNRDQNHPEYGRAKEINDFCEAVINDLDRDILDVLWDMLDALAYGNKVAEQVYELAPTGPHRGKLVLKALKVKPRKATAFVVDAYFNLVGLLGVQPRQTLTSIPTGVLIGDPSRVPQLLPRQKFAVLSYRPKDTDPRGQSIIRPAYNAWWIKQQVWPEYLKYLAQFGGPSLVGYTAEGAQRVPKLDDNGDVVRGDDGNIVYLEAEQALANALVAFKNGTVLALPYSAKVEPIQSQGNGQAFSRAIGILNTEIMQAILNQTLATAEGQHQARAASTVHQDVLGMSIRHVKKAVVAMVQHDILRPLITYNFGEEAHQFLPNVSLGETEFQDFAGTAAAVSQLVSVGFLDQSQFPQVDQKLSLPVRDLVAIAKRKEQEAEAALAAQERLVAASPPPGRGGAAPAPARGEAA